MPCTVKKNQTERETMGPHVSGKNGGRKDFIYRDFEGDFAIQAAICKQNKVVLGKFSVGKLLLAIVNVHAYHGLIL